MAEKARVSIGKVEFKGEPDDVMKVRLTVAILSKARTENLGMLQELVQKIQEIELG